MCAAPEGQSTLLYIDLHLVLEVTSRQTFDGLFATGGQTHQPPRWAASVDHNIPSKERTLGLDLAWVLRDPRTGLVRPIGAAMAKNNRY
jgi:homoaconitase/3-isopropylmalate dehydratase large subunit